LLATLCHIAIQIHGTESSVVG